MHLEQWLAEFDRLGVLTKIWVMTPLASALISFMTFIASMMQTTVSAFTSRPFRHTCGLPARASDKKCQSSAI